MSHQLMVVVGCLALALLMKTNSRCQVTGDEYVNVALGKPTQQIDTLYWIYFPDISSSSDRAVDGIRDGDWGNDSCTHTTSQSNTFWVVDLLQSYTVHHISITNRIVAHWRLKNFYIYVSEMNPLPIPSVDSDGGGAVLEGELCLEYVDAIPNNGSHNLTCNETYKNGIRGRYVYLWKPEDGVLHMCEFEVYVRKADDDEQNIGFSISPGKKISYKPPFFSSRMENSISLSDCVLTCMAASRGRARGVGTGHSATIVQMNSVTRTCECVEHSDLAGNDVNGLGIPDDDWTMLTSTANYNREY